MSDVSFVCFLIMTVHAAPPSAHQALERVSRVGCVGHVRFQGRPADQLAPILQTSTSIRISNTTHSRCVTNTCNHASSSHLSEPDDRRSGRRALCRGHHDRDAMLNHSNAGIGCAQVYAHHSSACMQRLGPATAPAAAVINGRCMPHSGTRAYADISWHCAIHHRFCLMIALSLRLAE